MNAIYRKIAADYKNLCMTGGMIITLIGVVLAALGLMHIKDGLGLIHILLIVIGVVIIGLGLFNVVYFTTGKYKKDMLEALKKRNIPEYEVASELLASKEYAMGRMYMGENYVIAVGLNPDIIPKEDIVWTFYKYNESRRKVYGMIPVGGVYTCDVYIFDKNHNRTILETRNELEARTIVKTLVEELPYVIDEVNPEMERLERREFDKIVKMSEEKGKSQMEDAEQEDDSRLVKKPTFSNASEANIVSRPVVSAASVAAPVPETAGLSATVVEKPAADSIDSFNVSETSMSSTVAEPAEENPKKEISLLGPLPERKASAVEKTVNEFAAKEAVPEAPAVPEKKEISLLGPVPSKPVEEPKLEKEIKLVDAPKVEKEIKLVEESKVEKEIKLVEEPKLEKEIKLVEEPKLEKEIKLVEEPKVVEESKFAEEIKLEEEIKSIEEPAAEIAKHEEVEEKLVTSSTKEEIFFDVTAEDGETVADQQEQEISETEILDTANKVDEIFFEEEIDKETEQILEPVAEAEETKAEIETEESREETELKAEPKAEAEKTEEVDAANKVEEIFFEEEIETETAATQESEAKPAIATVDKHEDKHEDKVEDKLEDKAEDKLEDKPEEKSEEKPEEKHELTKAEKKAQSRERVRDQLKKLEEANKFKDLDITSSSIDEKDPNQSAEAKAFSRLKEATQKRTAKKVEEVLSEDAQRKVDDELKKLAGSNVFTNLDIDNPDAVVETVKVQENKALGHVKEEKRSMPAPVIVDEDYADQEAYEKQKAEIEAKIASEFDLSADVEIVPDALSMMPQNFGQLNYKYKEKVEETDVTYADQAAYEKQMEEIAAKMQSGFDLDLGGLSMGEEEEKRRIGDDDADEQKEGDMPKKPKEISLIEHSVDSGIILIDSNDFLAEVTDDDVNPYQQEEYSALPAMNSYGMGGTKNDDPNHKEVYLISHDGPQKDKEKEKKEAEKEKKKKSLEDTDASSDYNAAIFDITDDDDDEEDDGRKKLEPKYQHKSEALMTSVERKALEEYKKKTNVVEGDALFDDMEI